MVIALAIHRIYIKIEIVKVGMRSMYIHISRLQTSDSGRVSSLIVTMWHTWHCGWKGRRFWCWLSQSVWLRCTHAFAPLTFVRILRFAILARKEAIHSISLHHCRVSFHCSHRIVMSRTPNSPFHLVSDFRLRFCDQVLGCLYCGMRKHSFGQFGHIQWKVYVGLC